MIQPNPILTLSDVSLRVGGNALLESLSFTIEKGDFVYLVGKTGSGKSSLLRLLYADLAPQFGQIALGDMPISGMNKAEIPALRRKLGIVFQDYQLLPDRSVEDNLIFAMKATGWKEKALIERRLDLLIKELSLQGKNLQFPHQLSGGEQQRVGIARALINDPLLLLADEPTGNLDPQATKLVMDALKAVAARGTAVLMATHEYGLLEDYPGKVLWLKEGFVQEFATTTGFLEAFRKMGTE